MESCHVILSIQKSWFYSEFQDSIAYSKLGYSHSEQYFDSYHVSQIGNPIDGSTQIWLWTNRFCKNAMLPNPLYQVSMVFAKSYGHQSFCSGRKGEGTTSLDSSKYGALRLWIVRGGANSQGWTARNLTWFPSLNSVALQTVEFGSEFLAQLRASKHCLKGNMKAWRFYILPEKNEKNCFFLKFLNFFCSLFEFLLFWNFDFLVFVSFFIFFWKFEFLNL
jgi:hypothetical protein